jgi:hypothetical protein
MKPDIGNYLNVSLETMNLPRGQLQKGKALEDEEGGFHTDSV